MKDKDPRLMTPEDLLESANKQVKYDELNKQIEEIIVANGKREASQLISDLIKDREQEAFEKGQADGRKQAYTKAIEGLKGLYSPRSSGWGLRTEEGIERDKIIDDCISKLTSLKERN
jgi:hypothetical protein